MTSRIRSTREPVSVPSHFRRRRRRSRGIVAHIDTDSRAQRYSVRARMPREHSHIRKSGPWPAGFLHVGQIFADRYHIERLLCGARASQVYEAVNVVDGRKVAVKAFDPQLLASAGAVKRFEFVMHADRRPSGAHVVATFEAGVDPETQTPFVVTELLAGETLESAVRKRGAMSARRLIVCMRQLAM